MTRYRWIVVARGCVIVTLGGFEAIHVGTGPYLTVGIGVVAAGVGLGGYSYLKSRAVER